MPPEYIPGTCNIGRNEIRLRLILAWICLTITLALSFALFSQPQRLLRLVVVFPAFGTALLFLQSTFRFCVHYGILGVFNVNSKLGQTDTIEQAQFRLQDRAMAFKLLAGSGIVALIYALILFAMF